MNDLNERTGRSIPLSDEGQRIWCLTGDGRCSRLSFIPGLSRTAHEMECSALHSVLLEDFQTKGVVVDVFTWEGTNAEVVDNILSIDKGLQEAKLFRNAERMQCDPIPTAGSL